MNWRKEKRSNETHESLTDPEARLFKKTQGAEAKLAFMGHVITENRNGLVVDVRVTQATGTAERDAAIDMLGQKSVSRPATVGADKAYDVLSSWGGFAGVALLRRWRRMIRTGEVQSMAGQHGMRDMPSASGSASGLKRSSGG